MIGDKLVITEFHHNAAKQVLPEVLKLLETQDKVAVSIAGESGCGKTELAECLSETLENVGKTSLILGQDDYFKLPPKTNHQTRLKDLGWVGTNEVHLNQMSDHIKALKETPKEAVIKPLVNFDEDNIGTETIRCRDTDVIIAEGTYTTLLDNIDIRVFINRTYHQTRKNRLLRNRDSDQDFLEHVLEIEHKEISSHRPKATIVIAPPADDIESP